MTGLTEGEWLIINPEERFTRDGEECFLVRFTGGPKDGTYVTTRRYGDGFNDSGGVYVKLPEHRIENPGILRAEEYEWIPRCGYCGHPHKGSHHYTFSFASPRSDLSQLVADYLVSVGAVVTNGSHQDGHCLCTWGRFSGGGRLDVAGEEREEGH